MTALPRSLFCAAAIGLALAVPARAEEAQDARPRFPLRILEATGPAGAETVRRHVAFGASIGFNAVWIDADDAARWSEAEAPDGPELSAGFLDLAAWCSERGLRLFLALSPVADSGDFVFTDPAAVRRLGKLMRVARRKAGVHDFVVSFEGAPLELREIDDIVAYGRGAAPAHVELARSLRRKLGRDDRLWLYPAVSSDRGLDDERLRYPAELLEALAGLSADVGLVWNGPRRASPAIAADDLTRTRGRAGGRPLLLADRFPANDSGQRMPLALVLGPLRQREPEIADVVAGYLSRPMAELDGSRLSLLTVADFLRDPDSYDPDTSWQRAIRRLAGQSETALGALRTQAAEWGGWIGELNYRTARTDNPNTAARGLRDPAQVASWTWVVKRYDERMGALADLADTAFRDDLLVTMSRRLAVARAVPVVRELLARRAAGRDDTAQLELRLQEQRAGWVEDLDTLDALDRFLAHATAPAAPRRRGR